MGGQRTKKTGCFAATAAKHPVFCNNNEKVVIIPEILISGFVMFLLTSSDAKHPHPNPPPCRGREKGFCGYLPIPVGKKRNYPPRLGARLEVIENPINDSNQKDSEGTHTP
jgi:hypothetical protein